MRTSMLCAATTLIPAGAAFAQNNEPQPVGEGVDEIVVTGIRTSLADAIAVKRGSDQIVDAISSEDIGKFPDQNIAESLQRVTGVQISRGVDQSAGDSDGVGEGTQVSIRGLRPSLNSTTVNGTSIASTTGGRDFDFSLLSPALVQRIEVYKTPAASQEEGALGGTVNLVTRSPLSIGKDKYNLTVKHFIQDLADESGIRSSGLINKVSENGNFGALLSLNYNDESFRRDSLESFGWESPTAARIAQGIPSTAFIARDLRSNIRFEDRMRYGGNLALEWQASDTLNLKWDTIYSRLQRDELASNHQVRFDLLRGTPNSFTVVDNTVVQFDGIQPNNNVRVARIPVFQRKFVSETLNSTVTAAIETDGYSLTGKAGYTDGSRKQDPSLFSQFAGNVASASYDITQGRFPTVETGLDFSDLTVFRLNGLSRAFLEDGDEEYFGQVDYTKNIGGSIVSALSVGVQYRDRVKDRERKVTACRNCLDDAGLLTRNQHTLAEYTPNGTGLPVDDFLSDLSGTGVIRDFPFADPNLVLQDFSFDGALSEDLATPDFLQSFEIGEEVLAAYVQADFEMDNLHGNVGVRVVETRQDNSGFGFDGTALSVSRSYTDVLPSLNIIYTPAEDLLVRFGAARVMTRPTFNNLNLGFRLNRAAGTGTSGNPDLDPFRANQLDLSIEKYTGKTGILSAAIFYKDIESFVANQQVFVDIPGEDPAINPFLISRPFNGDGGSVIGAEFTLQQDFNFLPGFWSGFGTILNYTYADSSTNLLDPSGEELSLAGLSEHSFNAIGYYENEKFSTRLAYNRRSDYVVFEQGLGGLPIIRDGSGQLDFSASINLRKNIRISFEAANLTNTKQYDFAGEENRLVAYRDTGRRFVTGIQLNF